jgi:hypothetical protein
MLKLHPIVAQLGLTAPVGVENNNMQQNNKELIGFWDSIA